AHLFEHGNDFFNYGIHLTAPAYKILETRYKKQEEGAPAAHILARCFYCLLWVCASCAVYLNFIK
ncbi:MAG: hypothetical protein OQK71_10920, partial [Desulfobacter sp.]|nr:hypothetical protein [Desulfobacter sp.]